MWLVDELNGYTHLENMQSNEVKKIIHNYRLVNFTFYRIDNQPVNRQYFLTTFFYSPSISRMGRA